MSPIDPEIPPVGEEIHLPGPSILPMLTHPIPRGAAGPMGWWYVFGSASITLLAIQVLTGIGLALVYVPAADKAYESLLYLNNEQPLGGLLRAIHYYAGSGMMVMVLVHMTQVFLQGAYKYPRELTWVMGVFLLLCTLGMFFSGQVLRWDPDAYWGLAVAGSMAGRTPIVGPQVVRLVLGGPVIGGDSLSRFFALHVFVIPGGLLAFLGLHLWLVLKRGVSEPPIPGNCSRRFSRWGWSAVSRDLRIASEAAGPMAGSLSAKRSMTVFSPDDRSSRAMGKVIHALSSASPFGVRRKTWRRRRPAPSSTVPRIRPCFCSRCNAG